MPTRWILHADLDAFYASVEQMDQPMLLGKPVVVGRSAEERGVVAAASYEARAYGVSSAMPMRNALRICPHIVRISPRFARYREISKQIMAIFQELTPLVEPLSLDEAYLDISKAAETGKLVQEIGKKVKEKVKKEVGLNVTIGAANTKSVAKIASQVAKPDGLLVIRKEVVQTFLEPLPVELLWGIGPKKAQHLHEQGISTIGQLAVNPHSWFVGIFGKVGEDLHKRALGIDDGQVTPNREIKSISQERTFNGAIEDHELLLAVLSSMVESIVGSLHRSQLRGRTISVKFRLNDFTTFTRQTTLSTPTDASVVILNSVAAILNREMYGGTAFRLIGVEIRNFTRDHQLALFREGAP
jgi:DNA polymerase-4